MCLVLGLYLGTLANSSALLLSLTSAHLMFKLASRIFKMVFNSKNKFLRGSASRASVDSDMYSTLVVERAISD